MCPMHISIETSINLILVIPYFANALPAPITEGIDAPLLVVSYDAFHPEYLKRGITPNLNKFCSEGTSAEFLSNVFPTKTFANHHTISVVSNI